MRYVVATRPNDGNKEVIWGNWNNESGSYAYLPLRIIKYTGGQWWSGYSGVSPTLNTVQMFYTKDGKLRNMMKISRQKANGSRNPVSSIALPIH